MTAPRVPYRLLTWDYREQLPLDLLREALAALGNLAVEEVDTDSDQYAIVISTECLTPEEAYELWRRYETGEDE